MTPDTVLIIAPYWRHPGHVGNYRVDRYVRWLRSGGYRAVIVRAGAEDTVEETEAGLEVTVRDPLTLYPDERMPAERRRSPNRLRRFMAYLVFNPDPSVVWARRAARHPAVEEHARGAACIVSSGPPDSVHVAGSRLAGRFGTRHIADLRDGWLDEPLKPLLLKYRLQRIREGRLERRILSRADRIVVTSDVWKELLEGRLDFTRGKTVVLTNGYPQAVGGTPARSGARDELHLLHAGRFTDSRPTRKPGHLLGVLDRAVAEFGGAGRVTLLGDVNAGDRKEIDTWKARLHEKGWRLERSSSVPRERMMQLLGEADGLLLLTVMTGTIPAKLFEYIVVKKPILAVTRPGSAVWRMRESVPQLFTADFTEPASAVATAVRFLEACRAGDHPAATPDVFSEPHLERVFMNEVMNVCARA